LNSVSAEHCVACEAAAAPENNIAPDATSATKVECATMRERASPARYKRGVSPTRETVMPDRGVELTRKAHARARSSRSARDAIPTLT